MTLSSSTDAHAQWALDLVGPEPPNWVLERPGIEHNVLVAGGGQAGCALAFALRRAGVGKVTVIDSAENQEKSGIWLTTARMNLLRTPKNLIGPESTIQGLSFKAWYTARHGLDAYDALERIPRPVWAEYLGWYRQYLNIPVRYSTTLQRIEPIEGGFRLHLTVNGESKVETARKVILANGFAGTGGGFVPDSVSRHLPRQFYAHTADAIDFNALRGKVVAVVGAAASAFDAAATALEAGAAEVHLFSRRDKLAATPIGRTRGFAGAYDNYAYLPDDVRWTQAFRHQSAGATAPVDSIERTTRFPNFFLHLSAPWEEAHVEGGRISAIAGNENFRCDFVIAGTGYLIDVRRSAPLSDFSDEILLWRDRYTPPREERNDVLGAYPYLGAGHELVEKVPGRAAYLRDIHVFNLSGFVSFGAPVGDVPSMRRGIPAVAARVSQDLLLADIEEHRRRLAAPVPPDFSEALYATAIWRGAPALVAD